MDASRPVQVNTLSDHIGLEILSSGYILIVLSGV